MQALAARAYQSGISLTARRDSTMRPAYTTRGSLTAGHVLSTRRTAATASRRTWVVALAYAAIGFSPIGALTLDIFGAAPLHLGAPMLVGMALAAALFLGRTCPVHRAYALEGFAAGLLAVGAYDAARWVTIAFGWWGDFIPSIGGWLLGTREPNVVLGYVYRWLGDGGGMGLAFIVLAQTLARATTRAQATLLGVIYGIAIWLCLIVTLLAATEGQTLLFAVTPMTFSLSLGGHLIYGAVLGACLAARSRPPLHS